MRVCLFRHSPLLTPSTSEKPFSPVAWDLPLQLRSPVTPQLVYPATGSNAVEICFGSNFGSVVPVAYSVPFSRGHPPSTPYFAIMKRGPPARLSYDAIWAVGRLLRELHDATASFQPPADAVWRPWLFHNDGPGSVVSEG
jgi:hypothetical protein